MSTTGPAVPFLDLGPEFEALAPAWFQALREIGAGGRFILGPNVEALEAEAAAYVGAAHAVGVANGTDALVLALRALGIGPGDEVITTPFTFFATAEAVSLVGATPVFADIDPASFNLDPASVAERIGPRTAAILVVHIFGHPADMGAFTELARRHGLALVEDCAQAFGAEWRGRRVGSFGDAAAVSFYPTKVLGCYGDGGMVFTQRAEVAERVRHLRNHGATAPFMHDTLGCNSRLDEVQAALLRLKLARIEDLIAGRRRVAAAYDEGLAGCDLVTPGQPAEGRHVFNLYTVRSPRRDALRSGLAAAGIPTSQCYPLGLHRQAVYRDLGYREGDLPVTDQACRETLSLPIYPDMDEARIARVCEAVRAAA
ncbi:DegT/DnrJ/EryC1/StrS family aminotransferase [Inmirania thermothiophila]|uniref:dTDP-4-amino-4,6-dideoxygalactose transaminase n=1 Tax=Inmirania thermothiophila TaxID=1750597 RepID=A0A3N1YB93_9GAMM|nr:DegT/DnrJ/EryC1/StrS family aminotransferase [Inmirania thermothiophila]ROR34667.1 dTDP-4-amino-4,6-dideoxygalactose transaminase [Inmirania thermothiophila]